MKKRLEGPPLKKGDKVIIVDDVATSGGSLLDSISVLKEEGVVVEGAITIIDREEGAAENLARMDCPLISIFKASEFTKSDIDPKQKSSLVVMPKQIILASDSCARAELLKKSGLNFRIKRSKRQRAEIPRRNEC